MAISITTSYPRIHTTGAVHNVIVYPADPGDGTPAVAYYYLGTCEVTPQISIKKVRLPVKNDLGGRILPFQEIQQGETAEISMLLNRYSNTAYGAMLALPQGNWASESAGAETRYNRGRLVYGLNTFGLIQVFDWYSSTFPGADKLIPGYYWPTCELVDHSFTGGTSDAKLMLAIKAVPTWNTSTLGFDLYSTSSSLITDAQAQIATAAVT